MHVGAWELLVQLRNGKYARRRGLEFPPRDEHRRRASYEPRPYCARPLSGGQSLPMASAEPANEGAVLHGINDLRVEPLPFPAPAPGEVVLRVQSVGICGSDDHYLRHGSIGPFVCRAPMVLGHESSAIVHAVHESVTSLAPGDRVAIEPGVPCAACASCAGGRYNLCPDMRFAATPPVDGSLARYISHPARMCYKMPADMTFDTAALLEPLSVGIHATRRAGISLGDSVLVAGCGTVGLLSIVTAKAAGAANIVATDIDRDRLVIAKALGADEVVMVDGSTDVAKLGAKMQVDACIECSGADSSVRLCLFAARPGGVAVLVGMGKPETSLPLLDACCREVDIRGVFRYCNTYPAAMRLASKVDLSALVTHRFDLKEASKAFDAFHDRGVASLKIIIDCSA